MSLRCEVIPLLYVVYTQTCLMDESHEKWHLKKYPHHVFFVYSKDCYMYIGNPFHAKQSPSVIC